MQRTADVLIGEVARLSGVSARMLRHYDRIGLVSPVERSSGDYRQYSDADVERLFHVESLRSLGLGLAEIATTLDTTAIDSPDLIAHLVTRAQAQLSAATELLSRLDRIRASAPRHVSDVLRIIELLRGFDSPSASDRQQLALSLDAGDSRNLAVLIEALRREDEPNAAGAVMWSLARIGDAAVPSLTEELDADESVRRHRALEALVKIGTDRSLGTVAAQVGHADDRVRARANIIAGMRGDVGVVAALVAQVTVGDLDIEAGDALVELARSEQTAREVVKIASHALAATDTEGRRRLTGMIACIPGPDVDSLLQTLSEDSELSVSLVARAHLASRAASPAPPLPSSRPSLPLDT